MALKIELPPEPHRSRDPELETYDAGTLVKVTSSDNAAFRYAVGAIVLIDDEEQAVVLGGGVMTVGYRLTREMMPCLGGVEVNATLKVEG